MVEIHSNMETAKQQGQRHGMALIEMGLLTPHQLNDALRTQVLWDNAARLFGLS